jgi:hypothetical protein
MEMLIKYTPKEKHIKCVPLFSTDGSVKLDRSQVELHPGVHEVTEDEWSIMKTILAGDAEITVVKTEPKSPVEKAKAVKTLKDVSPAHAAEIVKNCLSGKTLKKWYRKETREVVLLAILKQFKKINVDPFDDTEDESGADDDDSQGNDNPENGKANEGKSLEKMTKEELLALAAQKGITVAGTKEEIIAALKPVVEKGTE